MVWGKACRKQWGVMACMLLLPVFTTLFALRAGAQSVTLIAKDPDVEPQETKYSDKSRTPDKIYIFLAEKHKTITLEATVTDGTATSFQLMVYKPNKRDFEDTLTAQTSATFQQEVTLYHHPVGYRIKATIGGQEYLSTIWVLADRIRLERVEVRDACHKRELLAVFDPDLSTITNDDLIYYDLSRARPRALFDIGQNYIQYEWKDAKGSAIVDFSAPLVALSGEKLPREPFNYQLTVTTLSKRSLQASSGDIQPIAVLAKATQRESNQPGLAGEWKELQQEKPYEAPLYLKFSSQSENADRITWELLNDPRAVRQGGAAILYQQLLEGAHQGSEMSITEPLKVGSFTLRLLAENSTSRCRDSIETRIAVDSSRISQEAIPNVFTPNGDGINDIFKLVMPEQNVRSVQSFTIQLFTRNGHLVYSYTGDPKQWEGWNGRQDNTGRELPEGVYYYAIRAQGWDGRIFQRDFYQGTFHLFR